MSENTKKQPSAALAQPSSGSGRRVLGKGLGALIPSAQSAASASGPREYFSCAIERLHPQPGQPRQHFQEAALSSLVDSIREQGIIQPLVVRRREGKEGYEIIAGERRWRAAQLAGYKEVPIVVKDASAVEAFEMALVENIQREDLNPIEEAEALQRLIDDHGYTQAQVASRIGRDRSTVTNSLRLLGLPSDVRSMVIEGRLTEGHARALLQAGNAQQMTALARAIAAKGFSVRETERRARALTRPADSGKTAPEREESTNTRALVEKLQRALGARVAIVDRQGKGRLEVHYTSYKELDAILDRILR